MKLKKIKFDYSYVIIALSALMILATLGICAGSKTLYLTAITKALNIPRGSFALNDTFRYATTTIVNIFFGRLIMRFGSKKLILAGFVCTFIFVVMRIYATNLISFYIASTFLGLGMSWTGTPMVSAVIKRWCKSNIGTITGAVLSFNGLGAAIAVPFMSKFIFNENNLFGYRTAYKYAAVILIVVFVLFVFFFRSKPKGDNTEMQYSPKKKKARGEGWVGMDAKTVKSKPYFYTTLLCMFLTGFSLQGLTGITVPHYYDVGLTPDFVAIITSFGSILLTVSKFFNGFMFDRLGLRKTMNISYSCFFISLTCVIIVTDSRIGQLIAYIRSFTNAIALPLETVMIPLFTMEYFGNKDFDKILGYMAGANTAGFALGYPFGNIIFDMFGSYNIAFAIFGATVLAVFILMQYSYKGARRDRLIIESQTKENEQCPVN